MQLVAPLPYDEAIRKFGSKSPVTSRLKSAEWRDTVPAALRDRAFFSAQIENARFIDRAQAFIDAFLRGAKDKDGHLVAGSRAQFIKELQAFAVSEGMGPLDPRLAGGLQDITSEQRLGLIFDTHTKAAHDYGAFKQGQDPDVLDEFPAQRFIRVQDVKVKRLPHQLNEGRVELKSNLQFWLSMNDESFGGFGVPWGPWGFNSGMGVEDVDRDEAEAAHLIAPGEEAKPVDRDFNDGLQASVEHLDPAIIARLKNAFGDQVKIENGAAQWTGQPSAAPAPSPGQTPAPAPPPTSVPPAPAHPTPAPPPSQASTPPVIPPCHPALAVRVPTPGVPAPVPVSSAITVSPSFPAAVKTSIHGAIRAIDAIHSDGILPPVNISVMVAIDGSQGLYRPGNAGIDVNRNGDWPGLTTIHETGHLLDHRAIGDPLKYASVSHPEMQPFREAAQSSQAYSKLLQTLAVCRGKKARERFEYLASAVEVWARAYSQYIATATDVDAALRAQFDLAFATYETGAFWSEQDFAPIRAAIDKIFKSKGWM
jgi:hypothetical protein